LQHQIPVSRLFGLILAVALTACSPGEDNVPTAAGDATPSGAGSQSETAATSDDNAPRGPIMHTLVPLPGREDTAPEITEAVTVILHTSGGDVTIEVYPEAAPNAAARFLELVESGFYDGTPIFRIVPGFVAQFGVNWRAPHKSWQNKNFSDDEGFFALDRGTLAFAKTQMPNSASTQIFINYGENSQLAASNFQTFAKVVDGMEIVDAFPAVGDASMGLDQGRLWNNGGDYLASLPEKPAMIESAEVR
jgi:cyclophilin family peptidyl-prolyl cis-trans isomerase